MSDSIAIKAKNISFGYKNSPLLVLDNISFSIKKGEIIAVTSANVQEVNTLLSIITKQIMPDSGDVIFYDFEAKNPKDIEQNLCAVFSSKGFFPELSLFDNLFLGTVKAKRNFFVNRRNLIQQAQILYSEFGFNLTWHANCLEMTARQINEASLIRGFLINAHFYVFDQLVDELEPEPRYQFFLKCHSLAKQGRTVLFSTKAGEMALSICTQLLIIRQGKIVYFSHSSTISRGEIHCLIANSLVNINHTIHDELRYLFGEYKDPECYTQQAILLLSFFFKNPNIFCVFENTSNQPLFLQNADSDIDTLKQAALKQFSLGEEHSQSLQFNEGIFHLFRLESRFEFWGIIGIQIAADDPQNEVSAYIVDNFVSELSRYLNTLINEQILKEQAKQKSHLSSLGSLAGGIVHDFNNALFAIAGSAELLKLHDNNERQNKSISTILNVVQDSRKLTNKLLSFSRKGSSLFSVVDLHDLLDKSIAKVSTTDKGKNLIIKEFNATETTIECDLSEVSNALVNVISNALDATDINAGWVKIMTYNHINNSGELDTEGNILPDLSIVVSIIDNGHGIPAAILNKIFNPYFSTRLDQGGSGLGLSAAYGIIKAHNGNFIVKSKLNQGSDFKIFFPISKEVLTKKNETYQSLNKYHKKCILICDDNKYVLNTFRQMLENLGVRVLLAENGVECIKVYESNKEEIDLLILDDIMPVLSGTECFYRLKSNYPDLQAIIVTGYQNRSQRLKLQEQGILGIYKKPLLFNEIIEILNQSL